jgi:hypothetical protein
MTKGMVATWLLLVAGAAHAEDPRVKVASCTKASLGMCFEYRNETTRALGFNRSACDQRAGHVWSEVQPCPAEKRIAHCKRELLGSVTQVNFYPPATEQKAAEQCAALVMKLEKN